MEKNSFLEQLECKLGAAGQDPAQFFHNLGEEIAVALQDSVGFGSADLADFVHLLQSPIAVSLLSFLLQIDEDETLDYVLNLPNDSVEPPLFTLLMPEDDIEEEKDPTPEQIAEAEEFWKEINK